MSVFDSPDFDDHHEVVFVCEPSAGLRAVIALHRLGELGLAGGGCRMFPYPESSTALRDALRLSQAMSYKLAISDMPVGGGKTVVIGNPRVDKTEALLLALGRAIERLGGRYVIGEDVGTTAADMEVIAKETSYVTRYVGIHDTAIPTAYGVFVAIREAVRERFGRDDLSGIRVAVQGVGSVGRRLCQHLAQAGATLVLTDVQEATARAVAAECNGKQVAPEQLLEIEVDVWSPCAMSFVLDDRTIPRLRTQVVCGAANNQLDRPADHADVLARRGILYVPDFVANAGGVIGGTPGLSAEQALATTESKISQVLRTVFADAREGKQTPQAAAVALARSRLGS